MYYIADYVVFDSGFVCGPKHHVTDYASLDACYQAVQVHIFSQARVILIFNWFVNVYSGRKTFF